VYLTEPYSQDFFSSLLTNGPFIAEVLGIWPWYWCDKIFWFAYNYFKTVFRELQIYPSGYCSWSHRWMWRLIIPW